MRVSLGWHDQIHCPLSASKQPLALVVIHTQSFCSIFSCPMTLSLAIRSIASRQMLAGPATSSAFRAVHASSKMPVLRSYMPPAYGLLKPRLRAIADPTGKVVYLHFNLSEAHGQIGPGRA